MALILITKQQRRILFFDEQRSTMLIKAPIILFLSSINLVLER